jgi:CheY-like chemotaxis protein
MARLVVISKGAHPPSQELGEGWTTIGRADGNLFQVVEPSISGRHCEVRLLGGELLVRDLLSTNGTFVGDRKISECIIRIGETFRLGDVEFRFEASSGPPASGTSFTSKMLRGPAAAAAVNVPPAPPEKPAAPPFVAAGDPPFQVVFVDDSMAFLELFGGLCEEFSNGTWTIHKAASADAALAVLRDVVADLVLLDIGMPMVDGLQLLGIINRRYPGLRIAVMTGSASEGRRADALANGAELFMEKPTTPEGMRSAFNLLHELLTWNREGFTGMLRQVNLQEVIQVQCNGRHSSVLEIRNPEMRGQIYIEAGAIIHAAAGDMMGRPAFFRMLSLKGGEFQVKPFKAPPQRTIDMSWEYLLMDAARAVDEQSFPAAPPPLTADTQVTNLPANPPGPESGRPDK